MEKRRLIAFLVMSLSVVSPAKDTNLQAKENKALSVESVHLINEQEEFSEDNDFASLRRKMYGTNKKEFKYFSRWHKYLAEVEEEEQRKAEYDRKVAEYEATVEKVNKENEKIREYNENLANGNTVDVSTLNQENVADSKKD